MINPMQMIQMIQRSNNSQQIGILNQAMQMVNGKSESQVRQIAENMARERGVDLNQLAGQMGIKLPR